MASIHDTPSTAATLDAGDLAGGWQQVAPRRRIALVEGSTPQLTEATQDLLRSRLRASALILFAGFLAFLVRQLFAPAEATLARHWLMLTAHVAVTVVMGAIGALLCRRRPITLRKLRGVELLVFGGPALFYLLMQYFGCQHCVRQGMVPMISPPWLLLIFTYAMFVPNTWQRAATVVGCMAAAPVGLTTYLWFSDPGFSALLKFHPDIYGGYLVELALLMTLAAVAATAGVATIGSLRREVFEARQLGQYRLKQQLGTGGMGEVYLAEHQLLKRPCAIKVIRPEKAGDPRVLARFEREVRSMAKLSHWNTVEIFDYGRSEDGIFYYVMEYLPGLNLTQLVQRCGPMPPERVIYLMRQTCDALHEAHRQGLIHRDIKPGNIYAAKRGGVYDVAKLLDFGLVKPLVADAPAVELTQEGSITGSPLYMSPEQATGAEVADARTDIYSLGAVMYFLLTGQPPFQRERAMQVLMAHVHDEVLPPSQVYPDVPADLELVVLRALAKQPEDRYQDAESLRAALADCAAAGRWNRELARRWWEQNGCPKKRALDAAVLEAVAV